ncbi:hypothetical protein ACHQM5_008080 [Ranunculus cassubicifolius]
MMRNEDQQSRLLYELCTLVLSILKSPQFPFNSTTVSSSSSRRRPQRQIQSTPQVSPAGFASLLLGVSLALMLCGSVTFVIGFLLMPWVLGLIMVLYFVGIVSNLSLLGRAILCPNFPVVCSSPPPPPHMAMSPKEMSGEGFRSSVLGFFPIIPF